LELTDALRDARRGEQVPVALLDARAAKRYARAGPENNLKDQTNGQD
jgi:hypothetical protein